MIDSKDLIDINPHALEDLTVAITGTLERSTRSEAERLVMKAGGEVTGSLNRETDLLITGINAGSELKKAQKLKIKVITESEFIELINDYSTSPEGELAPSHMWKDNKELYLKFFNLNQSFFNRSFNLIKNKHYSDHEKFDLMEDYLGMIEFVYKGMPSKFIDQLTTGNWPGLRNKAGEELILSEGGGRFIRDIHHCESFIVNKPGYYASFNKNISDKEGIAIAVNSEGKIEVNLDIFRDEEGTALDIDELLDFYGINLELETDVDWSEFNTIEIDQSYWESNNNEVSSENNIRSRIIHCEPSVLDLIEKEQLEWSYSPEFGPAEIDIIVWDSKDLNDEELIASCNLDRKQVKRIEELQDVLFQRIAFKFND